jgi:hypothetical protein
MQGDGFSVPHNQTSTIVLIIMISKINTSDKTGKKVKDRSTLCNRLKRGRFGLADLVTRLILTRWTPAEICPQSLGVQCLKFSK